MFAKRSKGESLVRYIFKFISVFVLYKGIDRRTTYETASIVFNPMYIALEYLDAFIKLRSFPLSERNLAYWWW
jgi:hypothetical protein